MKAESSLYTYDVSLCRVADVQHRLNAGVLPLGSVGPRDAPRTQDLEKCMASHEATQEDIDRIHLRWQMVRQYRDEYLHRLSEYRTSPFPYRWDANARSSVAGPSEPGSTSNLSLQGSMLPLSFNYRFYKAFMRYELSAKASWIFCFWPDKVKYAKWAHRLWHGDASSSFLEHLEALEVSLWWAFPSGHVPEDIWWQWSFKLEQHSIVPQEDVLVYPDLSERELEVPDSLKGLLSSKGLSEDKETAFRGAWCSYRRNWPQTGRGKIWSLNDSEDVYACLKQWLGNDAAYP